MMHCSLSGAIARCATLVALLAVSAFGGTYDEGGYADRTSVAPGGTIAFHVATAVSPFDLQIVNLAHPNDVLATVSGLSSAPNDCTGRWETGCDWPVTTQFAVPATWPSGYYAAKFPISGSATRNVIFVVRPANPGANAKIVVISPTHTYTAYNGFGGKSLDATPIVSFNRPYDDNNGLGRFTPWEQPFVNFMTTDNRAFDVITDDDAEDGVLLNKYNAIILVGQSEYWTLAARKNLEQFIVTGIYGLPFGYRARGDIAIFGASTMQWQVRTNNAARQLICYRNAALDPEYGVHNDVVTVRWADAPVYRPENLLIGGSYRIAGHANEVTGTEDALPDAQRTPFTVRMPSHWVLAGTGLQYGDTFGATVAGTRADGATFTVSSGPDGPMQLYADGADGTRRNLDVLATIPAERGYGMISTFSTRSFGRVFNFGTRDWTRGLSSDAVVQRMTRNVLDAVTTRGQISYSSPYLFQERTLWETFTLPSPRAGVVPSWNGRLGDGVVGAQCGYWPHAVTLSGAQPIQLSRTFAPTGDALPDAELAIDFDASVLTATAAPLRLLMLSDNRSGVDVPYAAIEIEVQAAGVHMRAVALDAGGNATPTAWLPAYNSLMMRWKAGGAISLDNGHTTATAQASGGNTSERVNSITIAFPGTNASVAGQLCIARIRLRDPRTSLTITPYASTLPINPSVEGAPVHVEVALERQSDSTLSGSVALLDGDVVVGTKSASNFLTFDVTNLTRGAHVFTAVYSGSDSYLGSTSGPYRQTVVRRVRSDVNGDGTSDIVLQRDTATGSDSAYWLMNGTTLLKGQTFFVNFDGRVFKPAATGDLFNAGATSMIVQDSQYGDIAEYRIDQRGYYIAPKKIAAPAPAWHVIATRDFTSDGRDDLVLQNVDTGAVAVWQMNGEVVVSGKVIGNPGANVRAIDTGRFGGDAIVFQNTTTGAISRWIVNGSTITSDSVIATPANGWTVITAADFDGDGFSDLALQNSITRTIAIWLLDANGTTVTKGANIATPAEGWKLVGSADYDGNGRSDLLLYNAATNSIAQWLMKGTQLVKGSSVSTAPGWKPLGK